MKTIKIKLYKYDELSSEAKQVALYDQVKFEVDVMDEHSPYWKYAVEMEKMQTPWFIYEAILDKEGESIEDGIRANGFYFLPNGKIC